MNLDHSPPIQRRSYGSELEEEEEDDDEVFEVDNGQVPTAYCRPQQIHQNMDLRVRKELSDTGYKGYIAPTPVQLHDDVYAQEILHKVKKKKRKERKKTSCQLIESFHLGLSTDDTRGRQRSWKDVTSRSSK